MKKVVKDKRGIEFLSYPLIFIILNIVFFAALFIFVARAGAGVSVKEQVYAKQIVLVIDQAKPGTTLEIDISKLYEIAENNKYNGKPIDFNYKENKVIVRFASGGGYSYKYFTELHSGSIVLDETNKLLTIKC